ncbi:MAG: NAD(P)/FAD-dependent oxidoreductase [Candidatus Diapherotrites archaeon]|nr:NAD(P)/FAD-dependent oxidoreductase [Candidatus Diapherotrites archaeon]
MDLNIIGGGIAGLTCAIKLAEAGKTVEVFEKQDFIGKSEGENLKAIRNYDVKIDLIEYLKKNNIDLKNVKPIDKITKYSPTGKKMTVTSDNGPLFYILKKGHDEKSVDYELYEHALNHDVKIRFGQNKIITDGDVISVNTIYRNIWAHGAMYSDVDVDESEILFFMDNNYAPQGYIYGMPFGKHQFCLGSVSFDLNCALPILFRRFITENSVISKILENATLTNHYGGFAYSNIPETAVINKKLFIGSAAGFIDPARGFGVKYAFQSAILAANALTNNLNYDTLWKTEFRAELIDGYKRRLLLEKMSNADYEKLIIDEKVSIKNYEKIPFGLQNLFKKIELSVELNSLKQKYDLTKLFR